MSKFTEINYQGSLRGEKQHDYMWGVHAAGCADIVKEFQRQFGRKPYGNQLDYVLTTHEASSMRELLDLIVDGESRDLGWGDDNVKVHNCVAKALRVKSAEYKPGKVQEVLDRLPEKAIEATMRQISKRHILTAEERARGGRKARSK